MPMPSAIPRSWFVHRVFNPAVASVAGKLPPLGVIVHRGRTTGRQYRTPVLAFRGPRSFAIAMVYGEGTDWQRNIEAAGSGQVVHRGTSYSVTSPRLLNGREALDAAPAWFHPVMRLLRIDTVLCLDIA